MGKKIEGFKGSWLDLSHMNMILKVCKLDPPFFTKIELKYFLILSQLY